MVRDNSNNLDNEDEIFFLLRKQCTIVNEGNYFFFLSVVVAIQLILILRCDSQLLHQRIDLNSIDHDTDAGLGEEQRMPWSCGIRPRREGGRHGNDSDLNIRHGGDGAESSYGGGGNSCQE